MRAARDRLRLGITFRGVNGASYPLTMGMTIRVYSGERRREEIRGTKIFFNQILYSKEILALLIHSFSFLLNKFLGLGYVRILIFMGTCLEKFFTHWVCGYKYGKS